MAASFKFLAPKFAIDFVGSGEVLNAGARDICPAIFAEPQTTINIHMTSTNKMKKIIIIKNLTAFPQKNNYNIFKKLLRLLPL